MNFLFLLYYQSTALSSHAVDNHQMYFEGSIVGKASTIGIGMSPTLPWFSQGGQKVQNVASFSTSLKFEPLAFEYATRYTNVETNFSCRNGGSMSCQVRQSWVYASLRTVGQKCPTPKIARRKRAKSSITRRWIIRFRSNFAQSLNAGHPKCYKSQGLLIRYVTLWHSVSAEKRYNLGTDKLLKVKLGENYPIADRDT